MRDIQYMTYLWGFDFYQTLLFPRIVYVVQKPQNDIEKNQ